MTTTLLHEFASRREGKEEERRDAADQDERFDGEDLADQQPQVDRQEQGLERDVDGQHGEAP